jgi:Holliday junction resolvase RusA-like endonuclease
VSAPILQFRVAGLPVTQGDHKAWKPPGAAFARIADANPEKLKPWREAIRSTAVEALPDGWAPIDGPVRVVYLFALPKPASAPKTRRTWPTGKRSGDFEKLARAVSDALTDAGVWTDDARVVDGRVIKDYPEHLAQMSPGVLIRIWRADETPPPSTGPIPLPISTGEV